VANGPGPGRGSFAVQEKNLARELPEIYLHPGQQYVAASPTLLRMILGSCAGVFLFDRMLAIGGATHFMLPHGSTANASARYGDVAIPDLLERFRALGSDYKHLEAKVFGGGSMLSALRDMSGNHMGQIGHKNVEIAKEILAGASIPIVQRDVLGIRGRTVAMVSSTGEITLEFISQADGY
jgi:chemotaxis protein CheD